MKDHRVISHLLYLLAELAFAALLVGCLGGALAGGSLLMVCGTIAFSCLLTLTVVLHVLRASAGAQRPIIVEGKAVPQEQTPSAHATAKALADHAPAEVAQPVEVLVHEQPAHASDGDAAPLQEEAPELEAPSDDASPEPEIEAAAEPLAPSTELALAPESQPPAIVPILDERLLDASDPIAELKHVMGSIRTREAHIEDHPDSAPTELERYAARMLEEAGLLDADPPLPHIAEVGLHGSQALRLYTDDERAPYQARLRLHRIEAALNAIRLAQTTLDASATQQQAYQLNQSFARSIIAQAEPIDIPVKLDGMLPDGEWAVRYGISQALETLHLPYRLDARFRTNVADGNVAFEVELPPADVFPRSCHVDDLGIVPTTGDMRQRAAADYALRLALLLAASAFRCSRRIRHVWVAGIVETPARRSCYLCVDFDRFRFEKLDLQHIDDLVETYRSFAPLMRYEDGWLRPVRQSFHLEEERFCPSRRYVPVSLSSRRLTGADAERLGTDHVAGLSIEEADGRSAVAGQIMLRLATSPDSDSTQRNVRTVMELAGDDPDPTVRSAAERVIHDLIDGTLDADPLSVGEAFVHGDALTRANEQAKQLMMRQKPDQARDLLQPILEALDAEGVYADTSTISYRYFSSYVERALFNRLYQEQEQGRALILVPDAYYEAHLMVSVACLMRGQVEQACKHAQRMVELAPLDPRARLHLVKCYEELDRYDEAIAELCKLLEEGHEPQGVGFAYYRMASFQWMRGNISAAQACYQRAMQLMPAAVPMMAMELTVLTLQNPELMQADSTNEQIDEILETNGIPVAPTVHTSQVFYECAQASVDAEIFPVARNFAYILDAFEDDEVIAGLIRSLEDAPDHY